MVAEKGDANVAQEKVKQTEGPWRTVDQYCHEHEGQVQGEVSRQKKEPVQNQRTHS